jgi:hypothetical protein
MGIKYSTYAWATARGYIQHALRDFSRMVRTPRWVAVYKKRVVEMLGDGMTYTQIADALGIDESWVIMCDMSDQNYHISYDSQPEDWVAPEFVYNVEEHKAALLSPALISELKSLSDAEMTMILRYVDDASISEEEREWAADKFFELQNIAHGQQQEFSD